MMDNRVKYTLFILLTFAALNGFSQKIPAKLEAEVSDQVSETIAKFTRQISSIYTSAGETSFRFDSVALNRTRTMFYKYNDPSFKHISPNIIDPSKEFGLSSFPKDTNILPENFIVPIDQFLDSLAAWYCNDSCITTLELGYMDPKTDWNNYYIDPQLLCLQVFYKFNLFGEPYIPRYNEIVARQQITKDQNAAFDDLFEEDAGFAGQLDTRTTVIFLFLLDNYKIKETYIYKIYDSFIDKSVFIEDVRQITSERNKYYLSIRPYIGTSVLKADFSNINNFEQTEEFQPYLGVHIDFNYYFNDGPRRFTKGLSMGAGWSRFNATGKVFDYNASFTEFSEPFDQNYTKYVYADNIHENLMLDYADVNLLIKLRYRLFKNTELIGSIGPQASFLINSKIEPEAGSEGFVNYEGYFTDIEFPNGTSGEFLLQKCPEYGFTKYTDLKFSENEIGINKFNFCAYADIGLNLKMSHKFHLSFGIGYMYGFGNLVSESSGEEFVLSKGEGEVDNLFKNCTSLKISAPSAFVSAAYLINTKIK